MKLYIHVIIFLSSSYRLRIRVTVYAASNQTISPLSLHFFSSRVLMSLRCPWGNNLVPLGELQSFACSSCDDQSRWESSWIGHAPPPEALWQKLMEKVFFFSFYLVGCENQRGCVPNDILEKQFAALIPWVKANQRRVQKKVISLFFSFFSKRNTQIIKKTMVADYLVYEKEICRTIYLLKKCLIFRL